MKKTFIIAEAGVNHNANLEMALRMVDVAREAKADAVKFQTAIPDQVMTSWAGKADYQKKSGPDETQLEMSKKLHLPIEAFREIKDYCDRTGILFLSTAFDHTSLDYLVDLGIEWIKIPSGEITNLPYLEKVSNIDRKVILSTGMSSLDEIKSALAILKSGKAGHKDITVLHCNTEYPTPLTDVNLRAMVRIRDSLGVAVGYSDHTLGIEVPLAAVALGASVIEKHFTLDRSLPGPDHQASLTPRELGQMVQSIRAVELALSGTGEKRPSPSEVKNIPIARRSIVARRPIRKGELLSEENLIAKRPGTGISPMRWHEVIGTAAVRDFSEDDLIELGKNLT